MTVLIDTTVWSLALRRRRRALDEGEQELVDEWKTLVRQGRAALAGPVRQEILSGIRHRNTFEELRRRLGFFPHLAVHLRDHDLVAEFFNRCRAKGVTGSAIDMLLCALAHRHAVPIFTTDPDFERYARHLPIELHSLS